MRFEVELVRTDGRQVEGSVAYEGLHQPITFSGWLEFLGILEGIQDGTAPPSSEDDRR